MRPTCLSWEAPTVRRMANDAAWEKAKKDLSWHREGIESYVFLRLRDVLGGQVTGKPAKFDVSVGRGFGDVVRRQVDATALVDFGDLGRHTTTVKAELKYEDDALSPGWEGEPDFYINGKRVKSRKDIATVTKGSGGR